MLDKAWVYYPINNDFWPTLYNNNDTVPIYLILRLHMNDVIDEN